MMRLKICGMKFPENIEEIAALRPDYMGFIFYERSPRFLDAVIPALHQGIKKTGVFVNASLTYIINAVREHQLQAVQLHGEETPQFCLDLRQKMGEQQVEIIKVFPVAEKLSNEVLKPYEGKADFFLFDTLGESRGGTGKTFNWKLLLDYDSPTPFFLSGGIGLEEAAGITELRQELETRGLGHLFYGLDVNSRFETEPGRKHAGNLKEFRRRLERPS